MKEIAIYVCSFCKESFDSADAITCHILNTHEGNKTVKKLREHLSTLNAKSSKYKASEPLHKRKKPSAGQNAKVKNYGQEFYCDLCSYKTVYRSTYKRHLLTHEKGSRQHKCTYCSYSAIQQHNLKVHLESVHPFGPVDPVIVYDNTVECNKVTKKVLSNQTMQDESENN